MLSRTASNLYWAARYLERAEATARLLDACFQPGIPFSGDVAKLYALPLHIQDAYPDFIATHNVSELNMDSVSKFLISGNSQTSIKSCLELARENARSERSRMSSEVWEAINQTWIEFQDWQHRPLHIFREWALQRAFLFQGSVSVTMPETLSRLFLRLGTFLERANQTLRVLEAKNALTTLSNQSDYYQLSILLRSVSSFEAYQETVVELPSEDSVFEFLLFNPSIPRSVRYCVEKIQYIIEAISAENRTPSLKASSTLLVKLKHDNLNDVAKVGNKTYLKSLQDEILNLAVAIQEGHFVTR